MRKVTLAKSLVFTMIVGAASMGYSHYRSTTLCEGFLPKNNMSRPVGLFATGGITEQQFNDIMDRVEKIYTPEVEAAGETLEINRLWDDPTVNASAQKMGKTKVLNMYGGLARHEATTIEGMALVVCHEMGHHLGGAPKISGWGNAWASNEGEADYFSNLKCLRRFFAEDDNEAILKNAKLDADGVKGCETTFTDADDLLLCKRSLLAGQSVANLFKSLRNESTPPRYGTPDPKTVAKTYDNHPATQCRLDTYFAGMICGAKTDSALSDTDYKKGTCTNVKELGVRPRCWFMPPKAVKKQPKA